MENKADGVGFTRELLDDLDRVADVDADRVFATGLSNGGIMSHDVASELSGRIAAIAPVGGPLMMEAPRNKRPVPAIEVQPVPAALYALSGRSIPDHDRSRNGPVLAAYVDAGRRAQMMRSTSI